VPEEERLRPRPGLPELLPGSLPQREPEQREREQAQGRKRWRLGLVTQAPVRRAGLTPLEQLPQGPVLRPGEPLRLELWPQGDRERIGPQQVQRLPEDGQSRDLREACWQ
jgi:hypothetical protein